MRPAVGAVRRVGAEVHDERRAAEERAADDPFPIVRQQATSRERDEERLPDDLDLAREKGLSQRCQCPVVLDGEPPAVEW